MEVKEVLELRSPMYKRQVSAMGGGGRWPKDEISYVVHQIQFYLDPKMSFLLSIPRNIFLVNENIILTGADMIF